MDDYRPRVCIIDDCGADLYITHTSNRPIYHADTAAQVGDRNDWYTSSWSVECSEGHVVVLPHDHATDNTTFGTCEECTEGGGGDDPHRDLARVHAMSRVGEKP